MRVSIVSVTEGAPSYSSKHKKILTCSYMTHNLLVTGRKIFSQPQDLRTRSLRFFANRPVRKLSLYLLRKEALSYDLARRGVIESFPSFYITNAGGTFRTCSGRVVSPLYLSALSWCVRRPLLKERATSGAALIVPDDCKATVSASYLSHNISRLF